MIQVIIRHRRLAAGTLIAVCVFCDAIYGQAPSAPAAPTVLGVEVDGSDAIRLTWIDNANGESGFRVERRGSEDENWILVGLPVANSTNFEDGGLGNSDS